MDLRNTFWSIILLINFLSTSIFCAKSCPRLCDCFGVIVDCSNNELNKVPQKLPHWMEELNLSKNPSLMILNSSFNNVPRLRTLLLDDMDLTKFPTIGKLPKLKTLSLSGNALSEIDSSWLSHFGHLSEIDLSKNSFAVFNISEFTSGKSLSKLDLRGNSISSIEVPRSPVFLKSMNELRLPRNQIDDSAFKNLSILFSAMPNLKSLDLNRNMIKRPLALQFQNLTKLSVLKLRKNEIEDLPDAVFFGLNSLQILRLDSNKNITEITQGWLYDQKKLRVLSLSHNNIGLVKENSFESTKNLEILDLRFNRLGCVNNEPSFNTLNNLQQLLLSQNCLSTLDENTFGDLKQLKILDLSYNHLQWSFEDDTGVFKGLSSLTFLNLAHNKIEAIHGKVLHPLFSLTALDLSGNTLKTLPDNPFKNMVHLSKLLMTSSSLVCDCQLTWLPDWLSSMSFKSADVSCGFPPSLKDIPMSKLKRRDFNCDKSPLPIFSEFPNNRTVFAGRNMTLTCVVWSYTPDTLVTWTKDRKVVEPFLVTSREAVNDSSKETDSTHPVYQVTSHFHVDNVTHYDAGLYQCQARNDFGPTYSPFSLITVHRFPFFTERPVDMQVKVGGIARITCSASGFPAPEILLNKQGDFAAPREKRLSYSDHVYIIDPVTKEDDGIYTCTARNSAGEVKSTAKLSVVYTPTFSRSADSQVAASGQSIALECQGSGSPKPTVKWYKNGELVESNENRALVDNGQFLLLFKVQPEDSGAYVCELTNVLGTQKRRVTLSLKDDHFLPTLTGIIVMIVITCVVVTSFIWIAILYRVRRGRRRRPRPNGVLQGPSPGEEGEEMRHLTPHSSVRPETVGVPAPDSGSEHSSGKDSGVVAEDLQNGDVSTVNSRLALTFPDSPNGFHFKGPSLAPVSRSRTSSEVTRPSMSTFGVNQHSENLRAKPGHYSHYGVHHPASYASLRRGSSSKLMAVPAPSLSQSLGMNSLPRHAFRHHSTSNSSNGGVRTDSSNIDGVTTSLSRPRRSSRPGTPPPTTVTDSTDDTVTHRHAHGHGHPHVPAPPLQPAFPVSQKDSTPYTFGLKTSPPTYFTFHGASRLPPTSKKSTSGAALPSHVLPTR